MSMIRALVARWRNAVAEDLNFVMRAGYLVQTARIGGRIRLSIWQDDVEIWWVQATTVAVAATLARQKVVRLQEGTSLPKREATAYASH